MAFVYTATNMITGKIYVGVVVSDSRTLAKRRDQHEREARRGELKYPFYLALSKYGFESFQWDIIAPSLTPEEALKKEIDTIRELCTYVHGDAPNGYNCTLGGQGVSGMKATPETIEKLRRSHLGQKPSPETLIKRSASLKKVYECPERRRLMSERAKNRVVPESTRQKLSEGKNGEKNPRFGKKPWNEGMQITMRKTPPSQKERESTRQRLSKPVEFPELNLRFPSIGEAAAHFGVNCASLSRGLRERGKFKGITVRFANKENV